MNSRAHVILELPAPREREEEAGKAFEDLNTLTCRVRVVFSLFKFNGSGIHFRMRSEACSFNVRAST
jgi:hypothetical protein